MDATEPPAALHILADAKLSKSTMLLALTGWMDGGDVSTGTVKQIMGGRKSLVEVAQIAPDDFYIYNSPGNMETAALFRPNVKYQQGVVRKLEMPTNLFFADEPSNLIFFLGKEPNLKWQTFSSCIFAAAKMYNVSRIVFIGSFGGQVPHTRQPRLYGSVSHARLRDDLRKHGIRLSKYDGPASFSSVLLAEAKRHAIEMVSLVAEIPGYLEGTNPVSIEALSRHLARMLNQPIDVDSLREASNDWEGKVTAAVEENGELLETIKKLEEEYDNDLIQSESE